MNQQTEFNQVQIDVRIHEAKVWLYDYEPIEGRRSLVFTATVIQHDGSVEYMESPISDKFCAICNDVFRSLIKYSGELWPLGRWSKQRGYGWHYLSTREDERNMLKELARKYYGRNT